MSLQISEQGVPFKYHRTRFWNWKIISFCFVGGGLKKGLWGAILTVGGLWRLCWRLRAICSGGKAPLWDFSWKFFITFLKNPKFPWGAFRGAEILSFWGDFMDNWRDPYWLAFYWQIMGFGGIINGLHVYKQIIRFWKKINTRDFRKINKREVSER